MPFNITISDPLGFIAILKRDTTLFKWLSLLFQMGLSSVVTFCGVTGATLIAKQPVPVSIGYGLASVATTLAVFFGTSGLTKGMMLVRPTELAATQIASNEAITRRELK